MPWRACPAPESVSTVIPLHDDNPTGIRPLVTVGIIGACVLVFLYQMTLGPDGNAYLVYALGVIPGVLTGSAALPPDFAHVPPALSVLSSMFLHGGLLHLAGNMLYLWIFGNNVEDAMGHVRFAVFYAACGVAGALGQVAQDPRSTIPMIGASGAISGVLGAYLLLFPHARVLVFIPLGFFWQTIRLPAGLVLGLWFLIQFLSSLAAGDGPGVAWMAHVGGFLAGALLIPWFKHRHVRLWQAPRGRFR